MVVALGPGRFYGSSLPRPRFYTDVQFSDDGKRVDPPAGVLDPLLTWAREAHWTVGGLSFDRRRLQGRIEGSVKLLRVQEERKEKEKKKRDRDEIILPGSGSTVDGSGGRRKLRQKTTQVVVSDVEELALPADEEEAEAETESEFEDDDEAIGPTPIPPAPTPRATRSGTVRRKVLRRTLLDNDGDLEGNARKSVPASPVSSTATQAYPASSSERAAASSSRLQKRKRARKLGEEFDRLAAVDSPVSFLPASTVPPTSAGKRSVKKAPVKEMRKSVESFNLTAVSARKLGEEFDSLADADSTCTVED